jgi:hypothetical protein
VLRHELMTFFEGEACICRTHLHRTDGVCAFHDGEEIGPRMLVGLAKQTGLSPENFR